MDEAALGNRRREPFSEAGRTPILVRLQCHGSSPSFVYDLGRVTLQSDVELPPLVNWEAGEEHPARISSFQWPDRPESPDRETRSTLAGQDRAVKLWYAGRYTRMCIEGADDLVVSRGLIRRPEPRRPVDRDFLEVLLGPALITALALDGIFCLHASSVRVANGALLFLGDSGNGKSTLAAWKDDGWSRIADDIVPALLQQDRLWALPRFAQLRLGPNEQYPVDAPCEVEVESWFLLDPMRDGKGEVETSALRGGEALLGLTAHIVAARLFSPALAKSAFRFAQATVGACRGARLRLPWGEENLGQVRRLLMR